jgi:hypothetical protein
MSPEQSSTQLTIRLKEEFLKLKSEISSLIEKVGIKEKSYLQNYLYFFHFPLFSFTESVIILCESGKTHVATVLLRSLFEAHVNIVYHQVVDSKRTLALSAKAGFDGKVKNVQELKGLIRKYSNLKSSNPKDLFSDEWLKNAEEWAIKERDAILKGNNLRSTDKELDLKSKAIKCDELFQSADENKSVDKGHFERMYHVIFRQLSTTSHLNVEGMQTFISQDDSGKYLFNDGEKSHFIAAQAVEICTAYVRDLYDNKILEGEMPRTVNQIENLLKKF